MNIKKTFETKHLVYIYHIVICFHAVVFLKQYLHLKLLVRKPFAIHMLTTSHTVVYKTYNSNGCNLEGEVVPRMKT